MTFDDRISRYSLNVLEIVEDEDCNSIKESVIGNICGVLLLENFRNNPNKDAFGNLDLAQAKVWLGTPDHAIIPKQDR